MPEGNVKEFLCDEIVVTLRGKGEVLHYKQRKDIWRGENKRHWTTRTDALEYKKMKVIYL